MNISILLIPYTSSNWMRWDLRQYSFYPLNILQPNAIGIMLVFI